MLEYPLPTNCITSISRLVSNSTIKAANDLVISSDNCSLLFAGALSGQLALEGAALGESIAVNTLVGSTLATATQSTLSGGGGLEIAFLCGRRDGR